MREIKFRGKTKKGKGWIYGVPIQWCDGDWQICGTYTRYTVDENTISQYTGSTDETGKEIYEGDIVEWDECVADYHYRTFKALVRYEDGAFYPISEQLCWDGKVDVKIIGNIYDNKELLEEE